MKMKFEIWKLPIYDTDPRITYIFRTPFVRIADAYCKAMNYLQKDYRYFMTVKLLFEDNPVINPSNRRWGQNVSDDCGGS